MKEREVDERAVEVIATLDALLAQVEPWRNIEKLYARSKNRRKKEGRDRMGSSRRDSKR